MKPKVSPLVCRPQSSSSLHLRSHKPHIPHAHGGARSSPPDVVRESSKDRMNGQVQKTASLFHIFAKKIPKTERFSAAFSRRNGRQRALYNPTELSPHFNAVVPTKTVLQFYNLQLLVVVRPTLIALNQMHPRPDPQPPEPVRSPVTSRRRRHRGSRNHDEIPTHGAPEALLVQVG
jgi:hypothetical protein